MASARPALFGNRQAFAPAQCMSGWAFTSRYEQPGFNKNGRVPSHPLLTWDILDIIHVFEREGVGLGTIESQFFLRVMVAFSASQSRPPIQREFAALSGRSKVERLITFSTSAVAVCCCMHCAAFDRRAAYDRTAIGADRMFRKVFDVSALALLEPAKWYLPSCNLKKQAYSDWHNRPAVWRMASRTG